MRLAFDLRVVAGLALAVAALPGWGQAKVGQAESLKGFKTVPMPEQPLPTPFPVDGAKGRISQLEFRAPEAMTAADRALADGAQGEIARRAELQGFHDIAGAGRESAKSGGWGYEQAVCPAFPEHLILEYSRLDGPGDVTLFSAVVPRGGEGHVRVIPVRRRGYSLWTPTSSNALTLNDFNHMVKEGGLSPDWMMVSFCYAALAGGHVRAALIPRTAAEEHYPLPTSPMITVSNKGGAEVRMVDAAAPRPRGEWVFEFAQSGRLEKVRRVQPEILHEIPTKVQ